MEANLPSPACLRLRHPGNCLKQSGVEQLQSLLAAHRARRPASRAQLVRERLIDGVRPVRSLLSALVRLPWQAADDHPVRQALHCLEHLYAHEQHYLPAGTTIFLGRVWQERSGVVGFYTLFDESRGIVVTAYILNGDPQHRAFQSVAQYRELRDKFLNTYASCMAKNRAHIPRKME